MKKLISPARLLILFVVFMSFKLCESANKSNKISIDDFPMTVGSQWTYVRTDSLFESGGPTRTVVKETVTVQITGERQVSNNERIQNWVRTFAVTVDTHYAVIHGDTIMLANSLDPVESSVTFHFVFPLKIKEVWFGPGTFRDSDYYEVKEAESISVPAGDFDGAYLIQRWTGDLHNVALMQYWLIPKVGIVRMSKTSIIFDRGIEYYSTGSLYKKYAIWELIKYEIRK